MTTRRQFQSVLKVQREKDNEPEDQANRYHPGDFVLMDTLHDP